jgi:tetratricopeptide (TPR) repeat protein
MLKVYLAHSSLDNNYVRIVAKRLGRSTILFDEMSFPPGFDFRETIRNSLEKSTIFIFFASKSSLNSTWVQFEINEADWLLSVKQLAGSLTILIDDETKPEDLPKWMRRNLVLRVPHPQLAVYTIKNFLVQLSISGFQPIFVGRESDSSRISNKLIPDIGNKPPRIIVIAGLPGIGRRTFAQRALRDYLSTDIGPIFVLEDTDSIDKLYVDLLDVTTDISKREYLASLLGKFRSLDPAEKGKEVARLLTVINRTNQIPVILDSGPRGTLLDDYSSWYRDEWQHILKALESFQETYLLLIQPRLPNLKELTPPHSDMPPFATDRLGPLSTEAIKLLFRESVHKSEVSMTSAQIDELAPYIDGYPPAAKFALGYMKLYGVGTLLADKVALTDFLAHQFDNILTKLVSEDKEKHILRLLTSQTSLPLECISALIRAPLEETARLLRHLIDVNLVIPVDNEYSISAPIASAVRRAIGILNKRDYSKIANTLTNIFWAEPENLPTLSIVDLTIQALAHSNVEELTKFKDIILPTHLLKAAWQKYNASDWTDAITLANRTLQLDPSIHKARVVKFKAMVRLRRWPDAENLLQEINDDRSPDRFYLRGFMQWKRGQLAQAVISFRNGWNAGDQSLALSRDLAYCLMALGDLDNAKRFSDRTLAISRNYYSLDLAAQIAIYSDRFPDAERFINDILPIDERGYHHRLATLKKRRGALEDALVEANIACDCAHPLFEARVQRAELLIDLDKPEAELEINGLNAGLAIHSDMKKALQCKLNIKRGDWGPAIKLWNSIWQKSNPGFQNIRKEMLIEKIADPIVDPVDREQAIKESQMIGKTSPISLSDVDTQELG